MNDCSHSFNDESICEYCGLTEQDYDESCMNDEEIGTYN